MSAPIDYSALPKDEQMKIACELRPTHTIDELVPLFGYGSKAIRNWTRHMKVDLRLSRPRKRVLTEEDYCQCEPGFTDAQMNAYCERGATCCKCGKPEKR